MEAYPNSVPLIQFSHIQSPHEESIGFSYSTEIHIEVSLCQKSKYELTAYFSHLKMEQTQDFDLQDLRAEKMQSGSLACI